MRYAPPTPPTIDRYSPGYDCELPAEIRAELAKRKDALNQSDVSQRQAPAKLLPSWLRGALTFAGIVCVLLAIIAIAATPTPAVQMPTPMSAWSVARMPAGASSSTGRRTGAERDASIPGWPNAAVTAERVGLDCLATWICRLYPIRRCGLHGLSRFDCRATDRASSPARAASLIVSVDSVTQMNPDENSFLLAALEAARPDQIIHLLRIAEETETSIQEILDEALAAYALKVASDSSHPLLPDIERWCREVLEGIE
jgi:hypothetical protein